jgi:hypothetical protein
LKAAQAGVDDAARMFNEILAVRLERMKVRQFDVCELYDRNILCTQSSIVAVIRKMKAQFLQTECICANRDFNCQRNDVLLSIAVHQPT